MKSLPSRPKTFFVIYSPSRDLYSNGGFGYEGNWGKGKSWSSIGNLKNHLAQFRSWKIENKNDLTELKRFYKEDDYVMIVYMNGEVSKNIGTVFDVFLHSEKYKYKAD